MMNNITIDHAEQLHKALALYNARNLQLVIASIKRNTKYIGQCLGKINRSLNKCSTSFSETNIDTFCYPQDDDFINHICYAIQDETSELQENLKYLIKHNRQQRYTVEDIYKDLQALTNIDGVSEVFVADNESLIKVRIQSVNLDGYTFGPFNIELHIDDMFKYLITPYGSYCSEYYGYIHPHVDADYTLCTGDADISINNALYVGSIYDFIALVISVLKTYNSSSPYLKLDELDNSSRCEYCDSLYEDSVVCDSCYADICGSCMIVCASETCRTIMCEACHEYSCKHCGLPICNICDDNFGGLCTCCYKKLKLK